MEKEDNKRLICCYIGQDVDDFLPMSLESIKPYVDNILFVDGGSKDNTTNIVLEYNGELFNRRYEQESKIANSNARNFCLQILKEKYMGDWCLVLDPDEIVDDRFPQFVKNLKEGKYDNIEVASVHMRHLIRDMAHEALG